MLPNRSSNSMACFNEMLIHIFMKDLDKFYQHMDKQCKCAFSKSKMNLSCHLQWQDHVPWSREMKSGKRDGVSEEETLVIEKGSWELICLGGTLNTIIVVAQACQNFMMTDDKPRFWLTGYFKMQSRHTRGTNDATTFGKYTYFWHSNSLLFEKRFYNAVSKC